jgi:hypothetical protein
MRLSIGYLCPFAIPFNVLARMQSDYWADSESQLAIGYELFQTGNNGCTLAPNVIIVPDEVSQYVEALDAHRLKSLGIAIMMAAGDRLLDRTDPTEPDLAAFPD